MNLAPFIIVGACVVLVGSVIFILIKKTSGAKSIFKASQDAKNIREGAKEDAEKIRREASIEAKEKLLNLKADFERQTHDGRRKLNDMERRLMQKEENLERRFQGIERKEKEFSAKEQRLYSKEKEITEEKNKCEELIRKETEELERISGLTQEGAKNILMNKMEEEAKLEAVQAIRRIEEET